MGRGVRRRELIAAALQQGGVASQADLCAILADHGIQATQATISRDLREIGAVKSAEGYLIVGPANNNHHAALADDPVKSMRQTLETFVISAQTAGNLLVLKTGPAQAQVVAVEFDRHPQPNVVGVIAGDDTIFLAMATERAAADLAAKVRHMAGLTRFGGAA